MSKISMSLSQIIATEKSGQIPPLWYIRPAEGTYNHQSAIKDRSQTNTSVPASCTMTTMENVEWEQYYERWFK